jgi:HEAT repeat protein
MDGAPPEDGLDLIVGPDDPAFGIEQAAWSRATAKAQALHSPDELLMGLRDEDWHVRYESIDRMVARWHDDERTLPTLIRLVESDRKWQVRQKAMMAFVNFDQDEVVPVANRGLDDPSAHVRWSAHYILFQRDLMTSLPDDPGWVERP